MSEDYVPAAMKQKLPKGAVWVDHVGMNQILPKVHTEVKKAKLMSQIKYKIDAEIAA